MFKATDKKLQFLNTSTYDTFHLIEHKTMFCLILCLFFFKVYINDVYHNIYV